MMGSGVTTIPLSLELGKKSDNVIRRLTETTESEVGR